VLGIITMRLVAGVFLILLERFKGLANGAYILVGWIGLNLITSGLSMVWPRFTGIPDWLFWLGMITIFLASLVWPVKSPAVLPVPPEQAPPSQEEVF
jgi:predicted tellurium resistance membrane protein TerC